MGCFSKGILFPRFFGLGGNLLLENFFLDPFFFFSQGFFWLIPKKTGKKEAVKSKGLGFLSAWVMKCPILLIKNDVAPWVSLNDIVSIH